VTVAKILWTEQETLAIRSLLNDPSHATAVEAILLKACGIRDLCFEESSASTYFNLGRRAAGLAIVAVRDESVGKRIGQRQQSRNQKREAENGE
jgi:hypothetical protein